jgi:hypothetical protein
VYLEWVHVSYDSLIASLRSLNETEQAESYQRRLMEWMLNNPKPMESISWHQLHSSPVRYEDWLHGFMNKR